MGAVPPVDPLPRDVEVAVVGGGQAGLATAFHLRRAGLQPGRDVVVLDAASVPGGAWPRTWDGLRLFSPPAYSSLPGWMMPVWEGDEDAFPPRDHVVDYLARYEERYDLRVLRPHRVRTVTRADDDPDGRLLVRADGLTLSARVVVSATGTWEQPFWPAYPGREVFAGRQLHAADYRSPEPFAGQRVVIVGGGNSAAQVLAEVSRVATTTWVALREPRFLPDDVDGRDLFAAATARIQALREGGDHPGVGGLGDIVMVASVKDARDRGVLKAEPMFTRLTPTGVAWADGAEQHADAVLWCTGFRPALRHLRGLHLPHTAGRLTAEGPSGTRATGEPRLHLVGYGDWTGPASATLIGVGRSARDTVREIVERLGR
jgi:cation diffusion facilitator CzcD-associated flavoprotein CzcO